MANPAKTNREKISTTIASQTLAYLEKLITLGDARSLADALDVAVQRLLLAESRERLECDTAAYFDKLGADAQEEEKTLGVALARSGRGVDVEREP